MKRQRVKYDSNKLKVTEVIYYIEHPRYNYLIFKPPYEFQDINNKWYKNKCWDEWTKSRTFSGFGYSDVETLNIFDKKEHRELLKKVIKVEVRFKKVYEKSN